MRIIRFRRTGIVTYYIVFNVQRPRQNNIIYYILFYNNEIVPCHLPAIIFSFGDRVFYISHLYENTSRKFTRAHFTWCVPYRYVHQAQDVLAPFYDD